MNTSTKKILIAVAVLAAAGGIVYAAETLPLLSDINGSGFRLNGDSISYTIDPPTNWPIPPNSTRSSVCAQNVGPNDVFIPANTTAEWDAFLSGLPTGVSYTSGACAVPQCTLYVPVGVPGSRGEVCYFGGGYSSPQKSDVGQVTHYPLSGCAIGPCNGSVEYTCETPGGPPTLTYSECNSGMAL